MADTYRLRLDKPEGKSWAVDKLKIGTKGKSKGVKHWDPIKYPGSLKSALETAVSLKLGDYTAADLEELYEDFMDALDEAVEELLESGTFEGED